MSVVEIPLDSEETTEINSESIIENKNIPEEIEENDTKEIEENNIPEKIENNIPEQIEEPPVKKPRGRPKGSTKPKEAPAPPPPKLKREPAQKKKAKPKKVQYEPSESEEELPDYVRQQVQPPPQQDLATQMLKLLQNHENVRTARRQQLYSSWFRHY